MKYTTAVIDYVAVLSYYRVTKLICKEQLCI